MTFIKVGEGAPDLEVYSCGLPGSGNNLLHGIALRCAKAAGLTTKLEIWHGDLLAAMPAIGDVRKAHIFIPVRHPLWRERSCIRRHFTDQRFPPDTCKLNVQRFCLKYNKAPIYVSYEALRDDAEAVGKHLAEEMNLEWVPFPEWSDRKSARRHHGAVYNGNTGDH